MDKCHARDSDGLGSLGKAEVVISILIPELWPLPSTPALKNTQTHVINKRVANCEHDFKPRVSLEITQRIVVVIKVACYH